jgi:hypothetical protein
MKWRSTAEVVLVHLLSHLNSPKSLPALICCRERDVELGKSRYWQDSFQFIKLLNTSVVEMITTCSYLLRSQLQSLNPVFQILRPLSKQTLDSRTRTADCVTVAVTCELPKFFIVVELLLRLWK